MVKYSYIGTQFSQHTTSTIRIYLNVIISSNIWNWCVFAANASTRIAADDGDDDELIKEAIVVRDGQSTRLQLVELLQKWRQEYANGRR